MDPKLLSKIALGLCVGTFALFLVGLIPCLGWLYYFYWFLGLVGIIMSIMSLVNGPEESKMHAIIGIVLVLLAWGGGFVRIILGGGVL